MEEKIKVILCENISGYQLQSDDDPILIAGIPTSAKEIASHFREFIEWYFEDANNFFPQSDENDKLIFWDLTQNKGITFDELYNYWLKDVEK